jgi:polyhydroxybutyrate depolymerase
VRGRHRGPRPVAATRRSLAGAGLVLALAAGCLADDEGATPADPTTPTTAAPLTTTTVPGLADGADDLCRSLAGEHIIVSAPDGALMVADAQGQPLEVAVDTTEVDPDVVEALVGALAVDQRTVRITLPSGPGPHPVLLELHGYTSNAAQMTLYSGLSELGADAGFVVVAVDGREPQARRWALADARPDPDAMALSDVAVIDAVVGALLPSFCGDTEQVYAAGMSNGAVFGAVFACHSDHPVRAVGSVAFTTGRAGCDDDRQVPTVGFHGTADLIVPFAGRDVPAIRSVLGWALEPAEEAMDDKAALNGCDGFEDEAVGPDVTRRTWRDCDAETVFFRIEGGGHGWPGPAAAANPILGSTATVDASAIIVEFFARLRGQQAAS